jgi:hypothetical protein
LSEELFWVVMLACFEEIEYVRDWLNTWNLILVLSVVLLDSWFAEIFEGRVFASHLICGFCIFSQKFFEKPSRIQNFRILESLIDFIFNFKVCKFMTKNFQKALLIKIWKFLVMNLQTLKLNIKSMSGSKILKFWIRDAFSINF